MVLNKGVFRHNLKYFLQKIRLLNLFVKSHFIAKEIGSYSLQSTKFMINSIYINMVFITSEIKPFTNSISLYLREQEYMLEKTWLSFLKVAYPHMLHNLWYLTFGMKIGKILHICHCDKCETDYMWNWLQASWTLSLCSTQTHRQLTINSEKQFIYENNVDT